jgi:hypothetical protein
MLTLVERATGFKLATFSLATRDPSQPDADATSVEIAAGQLRMLFEGIKLGVRAPRSARKPLAHDFIEMIRTISRTSVRD